MNIICTGISKSNKLEYFRKVKKFSDQIHKDGKGTGTDIKIYSVGDVMKKNLIKTGTSVNKHILNKDDDLLAQAALAAMQSIKLDIMEKEQKSGEETHNIISTHTEFMWQHHWKKSNQEQHLEMLNPDLFVTILDHEKRIQERQHKDPQWKLQKLDLGRVAAWQDSEARNTERWAQVNGKRHLCFGTAQSPDTMYKMINYPEAPVIYSNFPMTWLNNVEESYAKITLNNDVMELYGSVIDPRTIEIMKDGEGDFGYTPTERQLLKMLEEKDGKFSKIEEKVMDLLKDKEANEKEIVKCLTTHRDLDYYVAKVDVDTLYFPELVPSFGGVSEVIKAFRCSTPTYLIFPDEFKNKEVGPFEVYHSLEIFFGLDEFHDFLGKKYKKLSMYD